MYGCALRNCYWLSNWNGGNISDLRTFDSGKIFGFIVLNERFQLGKSFFISTVGKSGPGPRTNGNWERRDF